jgi:hypothetical protein
LGPAFMWEVFSASHPKTIVGGLPNWQGAPRTDEVAFQAYVGVHWTYSGTLAGEPGALGDSG